MCVCLDWTMTVIRMLKTDAGFCGSASSTTWRKYSRDQSAFVELDTKESKRNVRSWRGTTARAGPVAQAYLCLRTSIECASHGSHRNAEINPKFVDDHDNAHPSEVFAIGYRVHDQTWLSFHYFVKWLVACVLDIFCQSYPVLHCPSGGFHSFISSRLIALSADLIWYDTMGKKGLLANNAQYMFGWVRDVAKCTHTEQRKVKNWSTHRRTGVHL